MEIALWIIKFIVGPVVAVVVTLIVSEPLKDRLAPLVSRLGNKKPEGIAGLWKATYYSGKPVSPHTQVVELSSFFGLVVGRVVPHKLNDDFTRKYEKLRPLRVRGTVARGKRFTGVWFHIDRRALHHGAFDLIIRESNRHMDGQWLGFYEPKSAVETGKWEWERVEP